MLIYLITSINLLVLLMKSTLLVLQLFLLSAMISAFIKYIAPQWVVVEGMSADLISAIALYAITIPVGLFAFILWLNR
ncbi:MAG: hypothetical protein NW214_10980 [Pseudanabaenaceae cyanobacterium bins.39]|nr:hypothetical protein [Pseudanabaenaceae cyanobacterium bins.39]